MINREEHVCVSTMISMAKFDFSDMGKLAASLRKLEIPSFECLSRHIKSYAT